MGWFNFWDKPKPKPYEGRCRFDDIEDDIKGLKNSLQALVEDTEKAFRKLKERIGSLEERVGPLEEKGEWKPRFGERVRFRHSFFGEMNGIFLEAVFPERWSLMFRDPSCGGSLKHYVAEAKDVEKADE